MALFHQIKRSDENERIAKKQEASYAAWQRAEKGAKAMEAGAKRARKPAPNAKKLLTLRLDPDVIEHFKAAGDGWQTRMNEALRKASGL